MYKGILCPHSLSALDRHFFERLESIFAFDHFVDVPEVVRWNVWEQTGRSYVKF